MPRVAVRRPRPDSPRRGRRHTPRHERAGGGGDPGRDPRPRTHHVRRVHAARPLRAGRLLRGPAGRDARRLRDQPARPSGLRRAAGQGRGRPVRVPGRTGAGPDRRGRARATARSRRRCSARSPDATWTTRRSTSAPARAGRSARSTVSASGRPWAASRMSSSPTSCWTTCRSVASAAIVRCASAWTATGSSRWTRRGTATRSPPIDETIVPVGAFAFVDRLASTLTRGYALLIDYGDVGAPGGDIHGYRDHRVVEDVLADPGSTDITAGVDFALIANHAERRGLDRVPDRDAARRAARARVRGVAPTRARTTDGAARRSRRAGRGPHVERTEPRDPARRPVRARPSPMAAARHTRPARTGMARRRRPVVCVRLASGPFLLVEEPFDQTARHRRHREAVRRGPPAEAVVQIGGQAGPATAPSSASMCRTPAGWRPRRPAPAAGRSRSAWVPPPRTRGRRSTASPHPARAAARLRMAFSNRSSAPMSPSFRYRLRYRTRYRPNEDVRKGRRDWMERDQRSTSPTTKKIEPRIAMRSGTSAPGRIAGITLTLENDGVRIFSR